jgi:hypothetical protein
MAKGARALDICVAHRAVRLAVWYHREETSEHSLPQLGVRLERIIVLPKVGGRDGVAGEVQIPCSADAGLLRRAEESVGVAGVADHHDDSAACLLECTLLQ